MNGDELFDPSWFPEPKRHTTEADEWSEIPDGRGNTTLTAIAGAMRKQGMDYPTLLRSLLLMNKLTMTRDPMPGDQVELIARSVCRYDPDPDIEIELVDDDAPDDDEGTQEDVDDELFTRFSSMPDPEPIEWLWHPYLPAGRLTMIEGREGIGKGMMCVWLAKLMVTGAPFEPGGEVREPRPVLWFSAEDDPRDDIQPRLLASGVLKGDHEEIHFQDLRAGNWAFPKNTAILEKRIRRYKPGLVIFDPGRSYLAPKSGEESFNNEAALRPGMQALLHTAQDFNTTIVFVHHQNKGDGTARQRSTGSGVFRQVARQVLTLEMVGNLRALAVDKANHINMLNTVRSWDVREIPGSDTAQFVLGGHLKDYKTIDEWRTTTEKGEGEIKVELTLQDFIESMRGVDCDTVAPTTAQIMKDLGCVTSVAGRLRKEAIAAKLIDDKNKWQGCRS